MEVPEEEIDAFAPMMSGLFFFFQLVKHKPGMSMNNVMEFRDPKFQQVKIKKNYDSSTAAKDQLRRRHFYCYGNDTIFSVGADSVMVSHSLVGLLCSSKVWF